jgi:hypothetical protein
MESLRAGETLQNPGLRETVELPIHQDLRVQRVALRVPKPQFSNGHRAVAGRPMRAHPHRDSKSARRRRGEPQTWTRAAEPHLSGWLGRSPKTWRSAVEAAPFRGLLGSPRFGRGTSPGKVLGIADVVARTSTKSRSTDGRSRIRTDRTTPPLPIIRFVRELHGGSPVTQGNAPTRRTRRARGSDTSTARAP